MNESIIPLSLAYRDSTPYLVCPSVWISSMPLALFDDGRMFVLHMLGVEKGNDLMYFRLSRDWDGSAFRKVATIGGLDARESEKRAVNHNPCLHTHRL